MINKTQLDGCPIIEYERLALENRVQFLIELFGRNQIEETRILTPQFSEFPILYNGSEQSAWETMAVIAEQMKVPFNAVRLEFFTDQIRSVSAGGQVGGEILLGSEEPGLSALYWGQDVVGQYELWLNRNLLLHSESLVATLAYEFSVIKLLGENRITKQDKTLADLATLIFGLGIFNANASLRTYQNYQYHGWSSLGSLSQPQWGYALALFAHIREEKSPNWAEYLTPNIKSYFLKSQKFVFENRDVVLQVQL